MRISCLLILCVVSLSSCFVLDNSPTFEIAQSGLHYYFHEKNSDIKPQVGDEVHYSMTIRKGIERLNSQQKKENMPLSPKKNPILQAFKIMGLGDSITIAVFVDSLPNLMSSRFESGDTMFIDLRITDIRKKQDVEAKIHEMHDKADRISNHVRSHIKEFLNDDLTCVKTKSGLQYIVEKQGKGKSAKNATRVSLHYAGFLIDGQEFESTFRKDQPKAFYFDENRTQTVPGFTEGLKLLNAGSKATLIIPHDLAYGEKGRGPIPPASDIVIYVELLEVY